jgi:hypothetical protein
VWLFYVTIAIDDTVDRENCSPWGSILICLQKARSTTMKSTITFLVNSDKKLIIPLGGYTLPSSLWHSLGGRNYDF